MQLYDIVYWDDPLPYSQEMIDIGLNKHKWIFRTNDLNNNGSSYVVSFNQLLMRIVELSIQYKNVKCTQTLMLFNYSEDIDNTWDCTTQFKVQFLDGKITSVKLFNFEKYLSKIRIENLKNYNECFPDSEHFSSKLLQTQQ